MGASSAKWQKIWPTPVTATSLFFMKNVKFKNSEAWKVWRTYRLLEKADFHFRLFGQIISSNILQGRPSSGRNEKTKRNLSLLSFRCGVVPPLHSGFLKLEEDCTVGSCKVIMANPSCWFSFIHQMLCLRPLKMISNVSYGGHKEWC